MSIMRRLKGIHPNVIGGRENTTLTITAVNS